MSSVSTGRSGLSVVLASAALAASAAAGAADPATNCQARSGERQASGNLVWAWSARVRVDRGGGGRRRRAGRRSQALAPHRHGRQAGISGDLGLGLGHAAHHRREGIRRLRLNGTYFGVFRLVSACKWLKAMGVG